MARDGKKILVIDDEPDERTYVSTLLEDNGYLTELAKDGGEGMKKVEADPPDLITLDITMPEKSGVKFYREMRGHPERSRIPIVVVTGVSGLGGNPQEFHTFLSTRKQLPPPDGFIPKPIDPEKLLDTIRRLLV